jgi:hypothetical protein
MKHPLTRPREIGVASASPLTETPTEYEALRGADDREAADELAPSCNRHPY